DYVPAPAATTPAQDALTKAQTALSQATAAVQEAQTAQRGAAAGRGGRGAGGPGGGRGAAATPPDLTTVLNVQNPVAPQITADDVFYAYLFSAAPSSFADIKAKAGRGEPLAGFTLPGVKVTFN